MAKESENKKPDSEPKKTQPDKKPELKESESENENMSHTLKVRKERQGQ